MKLIERESADLEEALRLLDRGGVGFLPVVDEDGKLTGVITDGDVRRAFLDRRFELEYIINRKPVTMPSTSSRAEVLKELHRIHRRHMPLVNAEGVLQNVVVLNGFDAPSKSNWVVIMVGGLGSRLGELTKDLPKPMLEVGGKPLLERLVESFTDYGFRRFVFCVNYKSAVIESYFGDGSKWGIQVEYTKETKRMGTAGALGLIDFPIDEPFVVTNGDVLASINYEELLNYHVDSGSVATMCVKDRRIEIPYACVEVNENNEIIDLVEKPTKNLKINGGIYVLNPETLKVIDRDTFLDMPDLFIRLIGKGAKVSAFSHDEYWIDIGRPGDYRRSLDNRYL